MKNNILYINIIKIVLLICALIGMVTATAIVYSLLPYTLFALLPAIAYFMNKYQRKNSKKLSLYNMITLIYIIASGVFIVLLLYLIKNALINGDFINDSSGAIAYLNIILILLIIIDCITNLKVYKNNVIILVTLFIVFICFRMTFNWHLYDIDMQTSYFYNNNFIIFILMCLSMITNLIELKRIKINNNLDI